MSRRPDYSSPAPLPTPRRIREREEPDPPRAPHHPPNRVFESARVLRVEIVGIKTAV